MSEEIGAGSEFTRHTSHRNIAKSTQVIVTNKTHEMNKLAGEIRVQCNKNICIFIFQHKPSVASTALSMSADVCDDDPSVSSYNSIHITHMCTVIGI